jgi:hypothetical protein
MAVLAPAAAERRVVPPGMRGSRLTPPPCRAPTVSPATTGVKRSAVLGTSSTLLRRVAVMVAVAVMPGRRLRSALSTSSQVR